MARVSLQKSLAPRSAAQQLLSEFLYSEHEAIRRMAEARLALASSGPACWIVLAGTSKGTVLPELAEVSKSIGRELARWGYGLHPVGVEGVPGLAVDAYADQLALNQIDPKGSLRLDALTEDHFESGVKLTEHQSVWSRFVDDAAAVIAIGGDDITLNLCTRASSIGKTVIPVRGSGGAAATIELTFGNQNDTEARMEAIASISIPLNSQKAIVQVARSVIKFLPPPLDDRRQYEIA